MDNDSRAADNSLKERDLKGLGSGLVNRGPDYRLQGREKFLNEALTGRLIIFKPHERPALALEGSSLASLRKLPVSRTAGVSHLPGDDPGF